MRKAKLQPLVADQVPPNSRQKSTSFAAQVSELEIGECAVKAIVISPSSSLRSLAEDGPNIRESVRNNLSPSVRQAANRTGFKYTIEVAEVRTVAGNMYVMGIVTRLP